MRQGQQNRRGRGRNNNNNNRKGHHNPLARSFESNGPDVKIRGTPSHIAEKYIALARDAQTSGDPVLAENYLQHAEHYSRIIMAYREQLNQAGDGMNGNGQRRPGDVMDMGGDFGDDDADQGDDGFSQPVAPQQNVPQHGRPQGGGDHNRPDRPFRRDQNRPRDRFNDRGDRGDRGDRADRGERFGQGQGEPREPSPPQERPAETGTENGDSRRRGERFQPQHEQPDFLRRPVRRARSENGEPSKDE